MSFLNYTTHDKTFLQHSCPYFSWMTTEFIAYIYEIAEKSPQEQFEGSMTMGAVMTL
jgi:hypothetical protein